MPLVSKGIMNGPETTCEAGQVRLKTLKSVLEIKCGKPFVVGHIWTCNQIAEHKSGRFNLIFRRWAVFVAAGVARMSRGSANLKCRAAHGLLSGDTSQALNLAEQNVIVHPTRSSIFSSRSPTPLLARLLLPRKELADSTRRTKILKAELVWHE